MLRAEHDSGSLRNNKSFLECKTKLFNIPNFEKIQILHIKSSDVYKKINSSDNAKCEEKVDSG